MLVITIWLYQVQAAKVATFFVIAKTLADYRRFMRFEPLGDVAQWGWQK